MVNKDGNRYETRQTSVHQIIADHRKQTEVAQHDGVCVIGTATTASCPAGVMSLHREAVSEFRFSRPCSPIPATEVPAGDGWLHETRIQLS